MKHIRLWQYVFFSTLLITFVSRRYRIYRYEFILDFMICAAVNKRWNVCKIILGIVQKQARLFKYININVSPEWIFYCIWRIFLNQPKYVYVEQFIFIWFIGNSIIITEDLFHGIQPLINWRVTAYFEIKSVKHQWNYHQVSLRDRLRGAVLAAMRVAKRENDVKAGCGAGWHAGFRG